MPEPDYMPLAVDRRRPLTQSRGRVGDQYAIVTPA